MADLDDIVTEDDVDEFRSTVKQTQSAMLVNKGTPRPSKESFSMEPEVNGNPAVVGQCKITQNGVTVADSEDLRMTEETFRDTACGNAVDEFKSVIEDSYGEKIK